MAKGTSSGSGRTGGSGGRRTRGGITDTPALRSAVNGYIERQNGVQQAIRVASAPGSRGVIEETTLDGSRVKMTTEVASLSNGQPMFGSGSIEIGGSEGVPAARLSIRRTGSSPMSLGVGESGTTVARNYIRGMKLLGGDRRGRSLNDVLALGANSVRRSSPSGSARNPGRPEGRDGGRLTDRQIGQRLAAERRRGEELSSRNVEPDGYTVADA